MCVLGKLTLALKFKHYVFFLVGLAIKTQTVSFFALTLSKASVILTVANVTVTVEVQYNVHV